MTNAKATKRALLSSALALFLCCAMLIGTTFAWFTDQVESKNNIITAGNLDIELYYMNDETTEWTEVTETSNVFKKNTLWEPGHVEVVKLKVVNAGTLDLKYQLNVNIAKETESINVFGDPFKLSDYIKYSIIDGNQDYTREEAVAAAEAAVATKLNEAYNSTTIALEDGKEKIVTMVVYMPESVGNVANAKKGAAVPTIELGINLYATQQTAEADSFGSDYDKGANHSKFKVTTANDLQNALNEAQPGDVIELENNITLNESIVIPAPGATTVSVATTAKANSEAVVLNLNGKTLSGAITGDALIYSEATLVITGGTLKNTAVNGGATINNKGSLTLADVNVIGAPIAKDSGYPSYCITSSGDLTIEAGTNISADRGCLFLSGTGKTNINGGTFTNNDIYEKIGGRAFTSHVAVVGYGANNKLTINGGTFKHLHTKTSGGVVINNWSAVTVDVKGGSFSGGNYFGKWDNLSDYGYGSTKTPFAVSGGTFTGMDSKYIASGFKAYQNAEGLWAVAHEDYEGFVADGVLADANKTTYGITNVNGYAWVEAQEDNFFAGKTITLENDIDFGGATIAAIRFWNPESKTVFDGQGFTLSNFVIENTSGNAGLFNGTLNIKNVNVEGATVTGKYAGVLAGNMYGNIDNCTVKGSTVNGTYWQTGVLAGQYNAGNVTNCVVEECTINGLAAVGGLVGILNETAGERTFENCIVKNCVINQTGSFGGNYDEMFGVAVGCINIGNSKVYFNNCTLEGNTLKGVASKELYGVEESTTTVYVNGAKAIHSAEELQKAVDVAADGATLLLVRDIIGNVTVSQKPDVKITIDGNGKTFAGTITVDGKSSRYETAGLTIQNVVFKADSISADACIRLGDGTDVTRYTNNVTVRDCTFTGKDQQTVAIKSYTGGDWNLTLDGLTVGDGMHSMLQVTNVEKGLKITGCEVNSKNGINLNNTLALEMSDCEFDVSGYAVRFGVSGNVTNGTYTIANSTLKAGCNDGDSVIIFRGTMTGSKLVLENTTLEGTSEIAGVANVVR